MHSMPLNALHIGARKHMRLQLQKRCMYPARMSLKGVLASPQQPFSHDKSNHVLDRRRQRPPVISVDGYVEH